MLSWIEHEAVVGIFTFTSKKYTTSENFKATIIFIFISLHFMSFLTFMSRLNFMLSWVEYEERLITSRPGLEVIKAWVHS